MKKSGNDFIFDISPAISNVLIISWSHNPTLEVDYHTYVCECLFVSFCTYLNF